ncbi:MAG: nicotinate-nucleotide adenylyltransferase [Caldisericia bacterium]|nr:nicotinate-nucleotide adenylyltransferase [Caldisericia bacterium]
MSKEAIGIMGGSFNPIHIGHLVVAEEARVKYNLKKVIFIPVGIPGYKKSTKLLDPERRFVMTLLATISNPYFFVSRIEIDRKGKCYTYDTIKELREIYNYDDYDLYFITGADAVLSILTWKNPKELLKMCYFIAATRPGYSLKRLNEKLSKIGDCCKDRVFPLQVPALSISSTLIRERIKNGYTIKYLVPKEVEDYIYKNNLYIEEDPWQEREKIEY